MIELILENIKTVPFMVATIMIGISIFAELLHSGINPMYEYKDIEKVMKAIISSIITVALLLILSCIPKIYWVASASLIMVYLMCLKNILLSLRFTGLEFPGLLTFLELSSIFLSIDRIKSKMKKEERFI